LRIFSSPLESEKKPVDNRKGVPLIYSYLSERSFDIMSLINQRFSVTTRILH